MSTTVPDDLRANSTPAQATPQFRVMQLVTGEAVFGVERYILSLCEELSSRGLTVIPVCSKKADVFDRLTALGLHPRLLPMSGYLDLSAIAHLKALAQRERVDLMHAHLGVDSALAACVSALSGIPVVASVHFDEPAYVGYSLPAREFWRLIQSMKNCAIKHFLPIRAGVADALARREGVPNAKMTVVHPGVPSISPLSAEQRTALRGSLGVSSNDKLVVTIARLSKEKDVETLIKAAAIVLKETPGVRFVAVGDGPLKRELQSLIDALGLSENFQLLGYRDDATSLLQAADIFALSSTREPFGIAAVEAMVCGKPVIGTNAGGLAEIVENERSGLLVPPGNAGDMAQAIIFVLKNDTVAEQMGAAGRKRAAERFSVERMANQVLAVYEQCATR